VNVPTAARTLTLGNGDKRVVFGIDDLCRHTMIFGSSGSGKTTRAYNPMLAEMLGPLGAGAFIIAAKAEAVAEALEIARGAGREALVIEPGSAIGLDLLSGSPDVATRSGASATTPDSGSMRPWRA
jgi:DNA helicase HerA-like ATPase